MVINNEKSNEIIVVGKPIQSKLGMQMPFKIIKNRLPCLQQEKQSTISKTDSIIQKYRLSVKKQHGYFYEYL